MCDPCREKNKLRLRERRKWYKQNGICPHCGKGILYGNEKNCLECTTKAYSRMVLRDREHYNKTHKEWSRKTHHESIAKGICTRCRKRNADYGFKTCGICRDKIAESRRLRKPVKLSKSERAEIGLCYFCAEPVVPGYKTCQRCIDRNTENAKKTDRTNHVWRYV